MENKKIRVIEITGEPIQYGGQEKFLSNLIENINESDFLIDVVTPYFCDNETFKNLIERKGGTVFCLGFDFSPGKSRKFLLKSLESFLRGKEYSVAHIHSGSISVLAYAAEAAKKVGIPKVIVHSHCTGIPSLKHSIAKLLFCKRIEKNATDFWACSYEAGADKFPKSLIEDNLVIVKNGIKIDKFMRDESKRNTMRDRLEINEGCFVIGHVGRFSFQKNHDFILDVFCEVVKRIPNCKLLLVGDGELGQEIRQKAIDLQIDRQIVYTGNVDNVEDYYQAMDVFLFPSRFEGFGYVALEAQAAGIPCLIADTVPSEVMVSDLVESLPLADSSKWVEEVISLNNKIAVENTEVIREAGYDLSNTVDLIIKEYNQEKRITI